jgi:DNA-binding transcriptional MerR regulator
VYGISVAAELAGMGVQMLRLYEARGLLEPDRTAGGTRRYSDNDIERLRRIGALLDAGLNIAGIAMVLDLEQVNAELRAEGTGRPSGPAPSRFAGASGGQGGAMSRAADAGETRPAGSGVSDQEMVRQVADQTPSDLLAEAVFEQESDGASTDTEAAKAGLTGPED